MEYDKTLPFKGRKHHFKTWYKKFSDEYEELSEKDGALKAFSCLSQKRQEIEKQLVLIKGDIEVFSQMLSNILRPDDETKDLNALHTEISTVAKLTFSTETIGNFNFGALDRGQLREKLKKYRKATDQKGFNALLAQVPKAYKKRYLADKLHHQKKAINYLIEQLIAEDYPKKSPKLEIGKDELDLYLMEKGKTSGADTDRDFLRDIYSILQEIDSKDKSESELFRKNGSLIYKRAAEYALDDKTYFQKWGRKAGKSNSGFSFEWHQKKIKEIYEALF